MTTDMITRSDVVADEFSWQRVGAVAAYYMPSLKLQLILYPCVSLAIGIITYFMSDNSVLAAMFAGLLELVLGFMLYFAPIAFTRRSNTAVEALLPATWSEKATFILIYTLVVIPMILWGPKSLVQILMPVFFEAGSLYEKLYVISDKLSLLNYVMNTVQALVPLVTCLYVVMRRDSNRALMGMVWSVVSLVVLALASGIYGVIIALRMSGDALASAADGEALAHSLLDMMDPFVIVLGVCCALYTIVMACFTVSIIKNKQI